MKKNIVFTIAIASLIIGFAGGFTYGKRPSQTPQTPNRRGNMTGTFTGGQLGRAGFTENMMPISGTVIAKDDTGITLQLQGATGGSKIALVSPDTQVMKSESGTLSDIKTGATVVITGTQNADGSINAKTIQIRPAQTNNETPQKPINE